jgi:hypothetical protein
MYRIESCPCCGSTEVSKWPAVVAPFISHYALGGSPFRCSLLECASCSFRFFDSRLTAEEVSKLYSGYRGEKYWRERNRYEWWYSRKVNDSIGHDQREIESRKRNVGKFVQDHAGSQSIGNVLDYGGDRGQFIPESLGRERYVFEISDATPVSGVVRIGSEEVLKSSRFDFVMLCHVLEHVSDPRAMLQEIRNLGRDAQSLYYIEVPYERVSLKLAGSGKLYEKYVDMLLGFEPCLIAMDAYSTVLRLRWNVITPVSIIKCHEHLNFFHEKSLEALLNNAGFNVVGCRTTGVQTHTGLSKVLQVLARRTE